MAGTSRVGIRWTIGDVSERGFEALRLSIWGAWRIFGPETAYAVCVNSLPLTLARQRTGDVPAAVAWHRCDSKIPSFLRAHLDGGLAEGVAWKLAPLRLFPRRFEIALDNDCILWAMPEAVRRWLSGSFDRVCVLAEDVVAGFGQFAPLCGPAPRNSGIRGLPPGFDLTRALRGVLNTHPVRLVSPSLTSRGSRWRRCRAPQPRWSSASRKSPSARPRRRTFSGSERGAHFVGINVTRARPFYDGVALSRIAEHWELWKHDVYGAVGLSTDAAP